MESEKPLVWLHGEVKTPPFTSVARVEAGLLLRRLQEGDSLGMPHSKPMPSIGAHCHELRVRDKNKNWRIICRIDKDAIVILEVYQKTSRQMPDEVIERCRKRLKQYDSKS